MNFGITSATVPGGEGVEQPVAGPLLVSQGSE